MPNKNRRKKDPPSNKQNGGSNDAPNNASKNSDKPAPLEELDKDLDYIIKHHCSDTLNAELVERCVGNSHDLRFVNTSKGKSITSGQGGIRFIAWDHNNPFVWKEGNGNAGFYVRFIGLVKKIRKQLEAIKDLRHFHLTDTRLAKRIKEAKVKHFKQCENTAKIASALKIAQTLDGLSIDTDALDKDPMVVATKKECYIDLNTQKAIPPDKSLHITKRLGASYDVNAKCPLWDKFRKEVLLSDCNEDKELRYDPDYDHFMQKQMGYVLTALTRERTFLNLYGDGTNGKSIWWLTIKAILGDYCVKVSKAIIERQGRGGGDASKASPWIAYLVGARLAILDEASSGMRIDESAFKTLVSSDTQEFRRLHCSPEEFEPSAKFILAGNHEPSIDNPDKAMAGRWIVCKFLADFDGKEDGQLEKKLQTEEEMSGILKWMVDGWRLAKLDMDKYGKIQKPKCITEWGKDYMANEDLLGHFLEDCCELGEGRKCSMRMLSVLYKEWCKREGYKGLSSIALNKAIRGRKEYEETKSMGVELWRGIEIKSDQFDIQWAGRCEKDPPQYPHFVDPELHNKIPNTHFFWWVKRLKRQDLLDHEDMGELGSKEHEEMVRMHKNLRHNQR